MLFSGQAIKASLLPSGIAQLIFDLEGSSVNKFDQLTLKELGEAVAAIGESDARGVIFSSAKSTFIVGADITEFTDLFATGPEAIRTWIGRANEVFNAVEDLSIPTVAAKRRTRPSQHHRSRAIRRSTGRGPDFPPKRKIQSLLFEKTRVPMPRAQTREAPQCEEN